jgi:hypothetical protein
VPLAAPRTVSGIPQAPVPPGDEAEPTTMSTQLALHELPDRTVTPGPEPDLLAESAQTGDLRDNVAPANSPATACTVRRLVTVTLAGLRPSASE